MVEVATALFLRDGYKVKLESVAAKAGVTRQTIYNLFGSKPGLVRAAVDHLIASNVPRVLDFEVEGDIHASLVNLGRNYLDVVLSEQALQTQLILATGKVRRDGIGADMYNRSSRAVHDRVQDYLETQMRARKLIVADYDIAAEQLLGSFVGLLALRGAFGFKPETQAQLARRCKLAAEAFLRSYARDN
jgi:TetR/AcrR family transcriptional regulator, mexJK operon transcriptional repressor